MAKIYVILQNKNSAVKNLEVINIPFEDYIMPDDSVDLVYSASAFHWIPESIGYPKIFNALKKDGCFATFGSPVEISEKNRKLKNEIDKLESEYFPKSNQKHEDTYSTIQDSYKNYKFRDLFFKTYSAYRKLTADEYIGLLCSVSAYNKLPDTVRNSLLGKIRDRINEYGSIQVHDKIDLHIGRK